MISIYKISVIIPVYKTEKYIENTLLSLLRQTFLNYEIVIVDDGTPDRAAEKANYCLKNAGIPYRIIHQENKGQGIARNIGVEAAKGEWIYFLDSDDVIQPWTFDLLVSVSRKYPLADIIYTNFQCVDEDKLFKFSKRKDSVLIYTKKQMLHGFLQRDQTLLVPGTMYRSSFLTSNNIRHIGIRWSEDQHFIWQVLTKAKYVAYNKSVTYNYLQRQGSIMHSTPINFIIDAYTAFKNLVSCVNDDEVEKSMLSRWVFGCLHSTSKYYTYKDWILLYKELEYQYHKKILVQFASTPIKALVIICFYSKKLLYEILQKI